MAPAAFGPDLGSRQLLPVSTTTTDAELDQLTYARRPSGLTARAARYPLLDVPTGTLAIVVWATMSIT